MTTPNSVAILPTPKNLATSPAVGGTVDRKVSPITAANTSTTGPVLGASRNNTTASARAPYTSDSSDFMRQRPTAQPMATLPTILNRPSMASAHAPHWVGRPHCATTPGKWVARNAT